MNWLWKSVSIVLFYLCMTGVCLAGDIVVEMLDVGQADAILVRGAGKTVLIDAGEISQDKPDMLTVATQLKKRGITQIDMVFATHPHADHIGGMQGVLETFPVKAYVDNGFPHTSNMYENLMVVAEDLVTNKGMRYLVARKGQTFKLGTEARFEILAPVNDTGITGTRSDVNANSIVMKLIHGENCFLFTGDAEAETEALVAADAANCNILKASHHGSPHSSTPVLLDSVKPKTALISCGLANKHGHPGAATLDAYKARGIQYYRTDWQGAITVVSNGKTYTVSTEKEVNAANLPCININTNDVADFSSLKGIGKTTTDKIQAAKLAHNGPYTSVEDFLSSVNSVSEDAGHRLGKFTDYFALDCNNRGNVATASVTSTPSSAPIAPNDGKININLANEAQLAAMPGMNTNKARAVIEYRTTNGNFKSCNDLVKVKGIGDKTVAKFADMCVVDSGTEVANAAPTPSPVAAATPVEAAPGMININSATLEQLKAMGLPKNMAEKAFNDRNTNGPFKSCKDITRVKGIGDETYKKIADKCTVQ